MTVNSMKRCVMSKRSLKENTLWIPKTNTAFNINRHTAFENFWFLLGWESTFASWFILFIFTYFVFWGVGSLPSTLYMLESKRTSSGLDDCLYTLSHLDSPCFLVLNSCSVPLLNVCVSSSIMVSPFIITWGCILLLGILCYSLFLKKNTLLSI